MKKTHFEAQRFGITEAKFKADMRFALKKFSEFAWAADLIGKDFGHLVNGSAPVHTSHDMEDDTDVDDYKGIFHDDEGRYQDYFKPSAAARAAGVTGYNFIYEFTYDDEKTGYGYCYAAIF